MNIENIKKHLQAFNFSTLLIEELGWDNPQNNKEIWFQSKTGREYKRQAIAELSGVVVYLITSADGKIPESKERGLISTEMKAVSAENFVIFVDKQQTQAIWRWLKTQDKKTLSREHFYFKGQTGDLFITKLAGLFTDINEIEKGVMLFEVTQKLQKALDIEIVTKKFFAQYQNLFVDFYKLIEGIDTEAEQKWYASVLLHRLMFIYFLQKKGFVDQANLNYLNDKLKQSDQTIGKNKFYAIFLDKLFFEGFAKPENQRSPETKQLIGKVKYLNGGLFLKHSIELKYPTIAVADIAFKNIFALFDSYSWSLNDTPNGKDNEINPDVLGYIFEKYINQKAFGAYYTRTEITEYLCEQTVNKLILEQMNPAPQPPTGGVLLPSPVGEGLGVGLSPSVAGGLGLGGFSSINEMIGHLDAEMCKRLVVGKNAILPNLSLLDPACGSGAFLVAAMKVLINIYGGVFGRIDRLANRELDQWKEKITSEHPSLLYYIKKQIITNNLYGVDIMQEATEIAKLRLFLALVASATALEDLEPLPNIDFNIMAGNSLMGLVRVDDQRFGQLNIFQDKPYREIVAEKERLIAQYKNPIFNESLQDLKQRIDEQRTRDIKTLNTILLGDFMQLKINYEQQTWDSTKNKEGKAQKRGLTLADIEALQPFHWEYEFSEIFKVKNGFDAIITNPPWDVLQTDEKEFFAQFDKSIKKNLVRIEDWQQQFADLMQNETIRTKWLNYSSQLHHQSEYYKKSEQYKKILGGKLNLYSLFTLQCFNLLRNSSYCGIIVPSGIYSDANTSQLRDLLYKETSIIELIGISNEKFIFEGVDHRFKIAFVSFKKGKPTQSFKTIFKIDPREAVAISDLEFFFKNKAAFIDMPVEFIEMQSPELKAVMEVKNNYGFFITNKLLHFPKLETKTAGNWHIEFGSEFNMTTHSYLFHTKSEENYLPLYEGKMMHQFTHKWQDTPTRYWVKEREGRKALLGRKEDNQEVLNYQTYRIAYRFS
jgi:hypothetical protein